MEAYRHASLQTHLQRQLLPSHRRTRLPCRKISPSPRRLLETAVAGAEDFLPPQPASDQDILLVHAPEYVHKLKTGTLSPQEEMQREVPFSPELVRAFWLAAGGSILSARQALTDRIAINVGGGSTMRFPTMARDSACQRCCRRHPSNAARRQDSHRHDCRLRRSSRQRHRGNLCPPADG